MRRVRDLSCGDTRIYLEIEVRRVQCRSCRKVKTERLEFLADNPFYFVEGLNNTIREANRAAPIGRRGRRPEGKARARIRVLQRRAYGLRDEEYLQLKILTCMLPAL